MRRARPKNAAFRGVLFAALILGATGLPGCTWVEKNVTKPVKGFTEGITEGRLTITSDPPGADIYVNEVYQGKTPLTLTYTRGVKDLFKGLVIQVEKEGYLSVRREVSSRTDKVTFHLIRRRFRR